MKGTFNLDKDVIIEPKETKAPTCWICRDQGMVFYFKVLRSISYDYAYRCTCVLGQASSHKIPLLPLKIAEKEAFDNYKRFLKDFKD